MTSQLQGFRVSPQQRHLWLMQQPDGTPYHARCAVLIEGELDADALKAAVTTVVQRHEILRTVFVRTLGVKVPLQVLAEEAGFEWSEEDVYKEEQPADIAANPWDYEHGPMLRLKLLSPSKDRHVLLIALPALCSDAVGLNNFVQEVARALNGTPAEEMAQYIDLAEWQNELFESNDAPIGREFWLNQNLSLPATQRLPFEQQTTSSFEPAISTSKVSPDITSRINAIVAEQQATPAQFVLACWSVLLWRYLNQPTIVIGTSFDGRTYEELESSLGLFARYLPLQFKLDPNTRFKDLLTQTVASFDQTLRWQESFTGDVVQSTGTEVSYFPFCFDFVNTSSRQSIGDLTISILETHTCVDRFNLKLCAVTNDEGLELEFHYDSSLFAAHDINRFAGHFAELLANAADQPEESISRLNIVTRVEYQQLLPEMTREWETGYVHELFEEQVERTPDAVAVEFQGQSWTYAQLNARANQITQRLRDLGAGPETVVAICIERSLEMMAGLLGVLKAGACYLPLDPSYPEQRRAFMLEDAKPIVVLTQSGLHEMLATDSESSANVTSAINGDNLAYVIYTSGSTGEPKGVMISHAGLTNYLRWSLDRYSVTEGHGVPLHSPLTFDLTVTALFAPLLAGRKVVLLNEDKVVDSLASGGGFSFVKLTPAHLEALNQLLPADRAANYARALIVGGEALHGENLDFWKRNAPATRIINEYGPTETVVGCCVYDIAAANVEPGAVSIGRPISNMEVYLLNSELQPVPIGVIGEIYIGGVGLARGYLNRPELTAACFIPNPFSPGERLYRSGDLGRYLPDGGIQFIGRADHQVKLRGYRIELGEIESVLTAHPAVREAVVALSEDASGEKRLVAYVVTAETVSEVEFRDYVKERLPEYMIPTAFVSLERFPLTAHGKVDRDRLPAPENTRRLGIYVAPRTPTEETLAAMWAEVLAVESVSVNDNFFDLGGHSLLATRIIARVNQTFQLELPMHKLLEMPTIAGLAVAVVESQVRNSEDAAETARVLAELEQLSDEEAEALLTAQSVAVS